MKEILETAKAVPELLKAVYSDAVSGTLQEVGKIGVDAAKTFRLALFPLQFTAALQDRLSQYIDTAIRKVPSEQRIPPQQSLVLETCERLRHCSPEELVAHLYVELLARAMDRNRVGEAHPAFIYLISQIAPDEIHVLRQLGARIAPRPKDRHCVYMRKQDDEHGVVSKAEVAELMSVSRSMPEVNDIVLNRAVVPEELAQPELYGTFLAHLVALGLVSYTNMPTNRGSLVAAKSHYKGYDLFCIELSSFGELFYAACVRDVVAKR